MKVVRWLFSHIFLILLIVVVIYGYMFWGNLLGKETPAGKAVAYLSVEFVAVKDFVDAVKEKQARLNNSRSDEPDQQVAMEPGRPENADTKNAEIRVAPDTDGIVKQEVVEQNETNVNERSPGDTIVTEKVTTRTERKSNDQRSPESQQPAHQQREIRQLASQQSAEPQSRQQAIDYRFDQLQNRRSTASESDSKSGSARSTGYKNTPELADRYVGNETLNALSANLPTDSVDVTASDEKAGDTAADVRAVNSNVSSKPLDSKPIDSKSTDSKSPGNVVSSGEDASEAKNSKQMVGTQKGSTQKNSFISAELEKQLDNVDKQGRVIDQSNNTDTNREHWITARKSFYQRNYKLSEQKYQEIIDNSTDNFDAYGELGNVYFNQGKNKQAASAYYEAAIILVREGQVSRARSLLGVLRHLDNSKANGLKKLIDSEQS